VLPKGFEGTIFVLIMNVLGNKLGTNLLQLSISELRECRKINCDQVGLKKKLEMFTVRCKLVA